MQQPAQNFNIEGHPVIQQAQLGQAGRDLIQLRLTVFDNLNIAGLFRRQVQPSTQQNYRFRKVLLNKVKQYWIQGVLEKSLHTQAFIELGFEESLEALQQPFSEIAPEFVPTLPKGEQISNVFNKMGEGRTLLILGEPGAGKTITLLKLAQDLIARSEQDLSHPIPIVLNLSSWGSKRRKIADWVIEELNSKYQISSALGQAWVKEEQLLLLLDGLDEVKAERREACVQAINEFMQTYGLIEIVVTSRIKDYQALSTRLQLRGAIYIQSLTSQQVNHYLNKSGHQLEAVKTLLQKDTALQELTKSPLILSIITLAYQGKKVEELLQTGSVEEHRQHLFAAYIERMFQRRSSHLQYSKTKVVHWLVRLAQQMSQTSQTVFLIETIQPTWLTTQVQKLLYRCGNLLLGGLIGVLIGGFISSFVKDVNQSINWKGVITGGLNAGLPLVWTMTIKTVETVKFSWQRNWRFLKNVIQVGLPLALLVGLCVQWPNLIDGLQLGVVYGLIGGVIFTLLDVLRGPEIETKTIPNQGIQNSAKNAVIIGIIGGLLGIFLGYLVGVKILGKDNWWNLSLIVGLVFGLVFGGGKAYLQHFTLRAILYSQDCIPWNYTRFLDYATELVFMQKVGGGYIFIHRMVLEHFARMEPSPILDSINTEPDLIHVGDAAVPPTSFHKFIACNQCGHHNRDDSNFCTKCGTPLAK